jgi:hypothetical protein
MAKRTCDACGKEKDIEGGKTCGQGHFVCKSCSYSHGLLGPSSKKYCPICKKPLR